MADAETKETTSDVTSTKLKLPAGVIILASGGFAMFIGFMLIRKIVDIEV